LNPTGCFHVLLEFFRANHCHEQVNEEQQGGNPNDDRFHVLLLQLLAKVCVECARDKKRNDDGNEDEVAHKISSTISEIRAAALVKLHAKCVKK
jgi:hypothetical protein